MPALTRPVHIVCSDLFFVPVFTAQMGLGAWRPNSITSPRPERTFCAELTNYAPDMLREAHEALLSRLRRVTVDDGEAALSRRGGADHILLNPRHGAVWEANPYCEFSYGDWRYGAPVKLSVEQNHLYDGNLPWASAVHIDPQDIARGAQLPWRSTHPRDHLVGIAFGRRVVQDKKGQIDRKTIEKECATVADERICRRVDFPHQPFVGYRHYRRAVDPTLRSQLANVSRAILHDSSDLAIGRESAWFWPQARNSTSKPIILPQPPGRARADARAAAAAGAETDARALVLLWY